MDISTTAYLHGEIIRGEFVTRIKTADSDGRRVTAWRRIPLSEIYDNDLSIQDDQPAQRIKK